MFGGVFRAQAAFVLASDDLTGAAALPMFPAAAGRHDLVKTAEKANKSLG
jgi:hypothetical protein